MSEVPHPTLSKKGLLWSFVVSLLFAIVIYFVFVMPAEFNKDPTGMGESLGLMVLSAPEAKKVKTTQPSGFQTNNTTITVPAHGGVEYKVFLTKGQSLVFSWNTQGAKLYTDFHGEPEGDTTGYFESHHVTTTNQLNGRLKAPFSGTHGWYWENQSTQDVKVSLELQGQFTIIQ